MPESMDEVEGWVEAHVANPALEPRLELILDERTPVAFAIRQLEDGVFLQAVKPTFGLGQ